MRIAVIAHNLRVAGGLSVGRNVIASLARVAPRHEYLLLMPANVGYEQIPKPPRSQSVYTARRGGPLGLLLYDQLRVPRLVRRFRPDLVWGLAHFGLRRPGARQAFLFHQPQPIYDASEQPREPLAVRLQFEWVRRRIRRCLPRTQLVFCQTRTAAERFARVFGYQGRIALMPNAFSLFIQPAEQVGRPEVFDRIGPRFYLLCLTRYYTHKNLEVLVETFRRHAEQLRDVVVLLTIAADHHPNAPRLLESLAEPGVREHVLNVGPIRHEELAAYFRHCDGLILPTLLESFSGTYLEAMNFGRPILTSDRDFAREVCGGAARYFDPRDPDSIRDAILEVRDCPRLREQLVEAGRRQLQQYVRDWDSIVAGAMGELEELVGA